LNVTPKRDMIYRGNAFFIVTSTLDLVEYIEYWDDAHI
jgi:hypothetical protein